MFERLFCEYGGFEMKLDLKTVLTGSAASVALLAASSANASGYYIGLFGGISSMEDSFNVTTSAGTAGATWASTATNTGTFTTTGQTFDTWQGSAIDPSTTIGTLTNTTVSATNYTLYRFNGTFGTGAATLSHSASFDDGFVVGAAIGWDFGTGWRTELEAAYRSHDVGGSANIASSGAYTFFSTWTQYSSYFLYLFNYGVYTYVGINITSYVTLGGQTLGSGSSLLGTSTTSFAYNNSASINGELETWSFMFNVWYDFDFGDSPIHPFIGGGIGFAHANLNYNLSGIGQAGTVGMFSSTTLAYRGNGEETDWGFAYQLGAGLGFELGNGMMLSAQYRYFNTGAMDLSLADQIEVNLESHNFLLGLNIPLGGGM